MAGFENHTWATREKITLEQIQNINDGIYDSHYANAGAHNSIYRGKNMGTSYTDEQHTAVSNGTFDDIFIGDYWTISSAAYRNAHCNYLSRTGNSASLTTNHLLMMPDARMYAAPMNATNTTEGGYAGSAMFTKEEITVSDVQYTGLKQAEETLQSAWGDYLVLFEEYVTNAVTSGYPSAGAWTDKDRICTLPTEELLYGCPVLQQLRSSGITAYTHTIFKEQAALFRLMPYYLNIRASYWTQNIASASQFCLCTTNGIANAGSATDVNGVRPAFLIS